MKRALIAAVVAVFLWDTAFPPLAAKIIPPEIWFDVRGVVVENSVAGTPPNVIPDRTIHRKFLGSWVADIRREVDGQFQAFCRRASPERFLYLPEATDRPQAGRKNPTPPMDMRWWLEIPPNVDCIDSRTKEPWPAGTYRMTTTWKIHLWMGIQIPIERQSAAFTIFPDQAQFQRSNFILKGVTP